MKSCAVLRTVTLIALFSSTIHAQSIARLANRTGIVEIMRDGTWTEASFGQLINSGERVRTGAVSSAVLDLGPGNAVTLGEHAEIEVRDSSGSLAVLLETGNIKVVSETDIQVSTKYTTFASVGKPLDMELGYQDGSLNLTVVTGAVRNGSMVVRAQDSTKRTYTSGGRGTWSNTVVYPNVYFYPYVVYGNVGVVPDTSPMPPYLGYWPSQIIPPMTDPLRPPVHYPVNPFPNPASRNPYR